MAAAADARERKGEGMMGGNICNACEKKFENTAEYLEHHCKARPPRGCSSCAALRAENARLLEWGAAHDRAFAAQYAREETLRSRLTLLERVAEAARRLVGVIGTLERCRRLGFSDASHGYEGILHESLKVAIARAEKAESTYRSQEIMSTDKACNEVEAALSALNPLDEKPPV